MRKWLSDNAERLCGTSIETKSRVLPSRKERIQKAVIALVKSLFISNSRANDLMPIICGEFGISEPELLQAFILKTNMSPDLYRSCRACSSATLIEAIGWLYDALLYSSGSCDDHLDDIIKLYHIDKDVLCLEFEREHGSSPQEFWHWHHYNDDSLQKHIDRVKVSEKVFTSEEYIWSNGQFIKKNLMKSPQETAWGKFLNLVEASK